MLLSKIGEFGLINRIKKAIKLDSSVIKGTGDDCAVLKYSRDKYQLFTCDMLVEGVDFRRGENPYFIGRKALAVSISDIAACAGLPSHCVVALGLPERATVEFVARLLKGMLDLAKKYKINLVGGDLSRADKVLIDVSMLGLVEKKNLVLRGGAKSGDIIFVSGELGGSIFGKHLRFTPRLKEARFLTGNFKVNAMIDISDGLAQDLWHILDESSVGAIIYEDLLPLSEKARNLDDALYRGEDFELLFTMPRTEAKKLLVRKMDIFKPVGEITHKKCGLKLIDRKGKEKALPARGFRHF